MSKSDMFWHLLQFCELVTGQLLPFIVIPLPNAGKALDK